MYQLKQTLLPIHAHTLRHTHIRKSLSTKASLSYTPTNTLTTSSFFLPLFWVSFFHFLSLLLSTYVSLSQSYTHIHTHAHTHTVLICNIYYQSFQLLSFFECMISSQFKNSFISFHFPLAFAFHVQSNNELKYSYVCSIYSHSQPYIYICIYLYIYVYLCDTIYLYKLYI